MTELTLKIRIWNTVSTTQQSEIVEAVEKALVQLTQEKSKSSGFLWFSEIVETKVGAR